MKDVNCSIITLMMLQLLLNNVQCVPLGHFFQSVTSCDNLLYNMNIELRLTRTKNTIGFQTTAINWIVPQVRLNDEGKAIFF